MRKIILAICIIMSFSSFAQQGNPNNNEWQKEYRSFSTLVNDMVHTKLEARFDFDKSYMYGKVWLTLKPHFYATDSLLLDAKAMDIAKVTIIKGGKNIPLHYTYDSLLLNIKLDKTYQGNEQYTVYIEYISRPNQYKAKGSAAITDAKGLYFINPKGEDKNKPTQIWTQGETESNSVWLPIIDKPNQKTTQELYITVPDKYTTLSNGLLISQTKNIDGTRTDYWRMDKPHAPYLIFMGIGEYAVIKDKYKNKEVNYYVEKDYAGVAKQIFGLTPEMIKFYSDKVTGIDYPWDKYSQITARDYVSGAMENTTSTLHQESAQQNARQLVDGNYWESTIAHELFHQWFGDLVTCESWSNLTVNESMANYSETLWAEYKHGKDAGDEQNDEDQEGYLKSGSENKNLVRFYYADKEDVFDRVSYNKGGRVLHMLRNYVGDSAFFKSLNKYLTDNKFGTGSADKLRLAFEAVTGKDLNWYWNQWYFGSGHPKLDISYDYNAQSKKAFVYVKQMQESKKLYTLPVAIDVYQGGKTKRYNVWIQNATDTFAFDVASKPDLINVDGDKVLLCEKEDNKTIDEFIYQYKYAAKYIDRKEAIDFASKHIDDPKAFNFLKEALNDPYYTLRIDVLDRFEDTVLDKKTLKSVETIAEKDPNRIVRAKAITLLSKLKDKKYEDLFVKSTTDSSYTVAGTALEALAAIDEAKAISLLPELKKDMRGELKKAVTQTEILTKGDADFKEMYEWFDNLGWREKFGNVSTYLSYLGKVNNTENFKKGLDQLIDIRDLVAPYGPDITKRFNERIKSIKPKKEAAKTKGANTKDIDDQIAYIEEKTK